MMQLSTLSKHVGFPAALMAQMMASLTVLKFSGVAHSAEEAIATETVRLNSRDGDSDPISCDSELEMKL